jgi:hypothetical protein
MSDVNRYREQDEKGPKGIGGWLILPLLGLVISPFAGAFGVWQTVNETFPILNQLLPSQGAFVVGETIALVVLQVLIPPVLLILMFRQSRHFPRFYVALLLVLGVYTVIDLSIAWWLFEDFYQSTGTPFWDRETIRALTQAIIGVMIWIPYMMRSRRVRNTFTA